MFVNHGNELLFSVKVRNFFTFGVSIHYKGELCTVVVLWMCKLCQLP